MIWPIFGIVAYVFLVLQRSLVKIVALQSPFGVVEPQILLILGVLVGMFAAPSTGLLGWVVLGLLMDLTMAYPTGGGDAITLIGPYTLGFIAAGYTLLQLRTVVFREHAFSLGFAVLACGLSMYLVIIALFSIRNWYSPLPDFSARRELVRSIFILLYTAGVTVLLARPLLKLPSWMGLAGGKAGSKRPIRR